MSKERLREIFTTVRDHLLKQGRRSEIVNPETGGAECRYRAPDGLKCALGCLIPDELYTPEIEGVSMPLRTSELVSSGRQKLYEILGSPGDDEMCLMRDLQAIHDTRLPDLWQSCLARVARDYQFFE